MTRWGREYEDAFFDNSTWAEGDWNGDGDFDSGDFTMAGSYGGYDQPNRGGGAFDVYRDLVDMVQLDVAIDANELKVSAKPGNNLQETYKNVFVELLSGTTNNARNADADSMQIAVRWSCGEKRRYATNAVLPGEKWTANPTGAHFSTETPDEATQVDVVVLWTDAAYGHDHDKSGDGDDLLNRDRFDIPVITASWSAQKRPNGTWTIASNDNVPRPVVVFVESGSGSMILSNIAQHVEQVRQALKARADFDLKERNVGARNTGFDIYKLRTFFGF